MTIKYSEDKSTITIMRASCLAYTSKRSENGCKDQFFVTEKLQFNLKGTFIGHSANPENGEKLDAYILPTLNQWKLWLGGEVGYMNGIAAIDRLCKTALMPVGDLNDIKHVRGIRYQDIQQGVDLGTDEYWIASKSSYGGSVQNSCMQFAYKGTVGDRTLYNSKGISEKYAYPVRPIIFLKHNPRQMNQGVYVEF